MKIVYFLFTQYSASLIFLVRDINSTIFSKYLSFKIESWLLDDVVSGDLGYPVLCFMGYKNSIIFNARYDNRGKTIAVIQITYGFKFGGFSGWFRNLIVSEIEVFQLV